MHRLRVAHVINSGGLGGVPEAAYQLLHALPADRYDRQLYVLRRQAQLHPAGIARLNRFRASGIPVSFPDGDGSGVEIAAALAAWLRAQRIDILHTHSYRPNRLARLAGATGRLGGLRVVAHYHNQYDDKWSRGDALAVERVLARHTDAMVACSEAVRRHVVERIGVAAHRVVVVHNGVDLERFRESQSQAAARAVLGLPADRPLIGLVGRLCAQKGQADLIRAAPAILSRHPKAMIVLAGEADTPGMETYLRNQVEQLGVAQSVYFAGFIPDVAMLYAALDVVVAPSRWEGFGLALVEAMAAGRSIVAARAGAIPEVVVEDQTAVLVPPADPDALASKVSMLLSDPTRAQALGRRGRERARHFSWARAGQQLDALYTGL